MSTSSFLPPVTEDQIAHAKEVCTFDHSAVCRQLGSIALIRGPVKKGCESWTCAFSPDNSRYLAWSAGHRIVQLIPWDAKTQRRHDVGGGEGEGGRALHTMSCGEAVHSLAFGTSTHNCHRQRWKRQRCQTDVLVLATGHVSGRIKLWNCETGKLLVEILDHRDVVHDLHFRQDDSLCLASASRDGSVKLWEFDDNGDCNMYLTIRTNAKQAFSCRWSPDGRYVAATGNFQTALLFRVEGRKVLARHKLEGHHHDVVHCDFSPDGALLATASFDTRVCLWDVHSLTLLTQLGHLHPSPRPIYAGGANDHYVYSVKFSPDGTRLATVAEDGYLRVWEMSDLSNPVTIATVDGARCCSFSSDGQLVAVGTLGGSMSVLAAPPEGPTTLRQLCRLVIRRRVRGDEVASLPIPRPLMDFLNYTELQETNQG